MSLSFNQRSRQLSTAEVKSSLKAIPMFLVRGLRRTGLQPLAKGDGGCNYFVTRASTSHFGVKKDSCEGGWGLARKK